MLIVKIRNIEASETSSLHFRQTAETPLSKTYITRTALGQLLRP